MAKGSISKEAITNKLLETFAGSFQYDKEIRIPMIEDGQEVQIKVTLTCAKTNVECGDDVAIPGASVVASSPVTSSTSTLKELVEPTEEEKENLSKFLSALNL